MSKGLKEIIQKAIDNGDMIAIDYVGVDGRRSTGRVIEPFEFKKNGWNDAVVAYDNGDHSEIRSFNLNGIKAVNNV